MHLVICVSVASLAKDTSKWTLNSLTVTHSNRMKILHFIVYVSFVVTRCGFLQVTAWVKSGLTRSWNGSQVYKTSRNFLNRELNHQSLDHQSLTLFIWLRLTRLHLIISYFCTDSPCLALMKRYLFVIKHLVSLSASPHYFYTTMLQKIIMCIKRNQGHNCFSLCLIKFGNDSFRDPIHYMNICES